MTREERKEIWERYLTDSNIIEVKFIGTSDLLSNDPKGYVFVKVHKRGVRNNDMKIEDKESEVLFNFDKQDEVDRVTVLWCECAKYEKYLKEYVEDWKESYGENLYGMVLIDIIKDGEFLWNYRV